jgi:transcriptional regulator with XRE-family HTH domain
VGKLVRGSPAPEPARAPHDAVRQAREALGWTQERLADELGVLPAEVAAWESGAIALTPYRAAETVWRMELAAHEAALPRSDCYWTRANAERLARLQEMGPYSARQAERERVAHARDCAECLRVQALLRDAPPAPQPPVKPGPRGWREAWRRRVDGMPAWLRLPIRAAESLLWVGGLYLLVHLLAFADDPEQGFRPSLTVFLGLFAGVTWFGFLGRRLQPALDRNPLLGGQLFGAGMAIPANLVLALYGITDPGSAGSWMLLLVMGVVLGWWVGREEQVAQEHEAAALEPALAVEPPEREVFIRQPDTSFRI